MLTGLIAASSGDASIRGMKISSDMQAIRSTLGVCPQHDILFPDLTVMQHLQMFATFKGVSSDEVNAAAQKMIAEVGLTEKANIKSSMLSGGQKRKLSVGIALIGDSKIVILDGNVFRIYLLQIITSMFITYIHLNYRANKWNGSLFSSIYLEYHSKK